jgi:hypothetical protein
MHKMLRFVLSCFIFLSLLLGVLVYFNQKPLTVTYLPSQEDRAGPWGQYQGGASRIYGYPQDWKFAVTLRLNEAKTLKWMAIMHQVPGEGWCTSRKTLIYGKNCYPIVIDYAGQQINFRDDEPLGTFDAGTHSFTLYTQKESSPFAGGVLAVKFTDGQELRTLIPQENGMIPNLVPDLAQIEDIEGKNLPETGVRLSATYRGDREDRAGGYHGFGPGTGGCCGNRDFRIDATLELPLEKSIASIIMTHLIPGQIWTTSQPALYPIVVFNQNGQLNHSFEKELGALDAGTYDFTLYLQKESEDFHGGTLTFTFTDGTSISCEVPKEAPPER